MINLGPGDFVLIGLALLLVFGAGRLPALGDAIGRALRGAPPPTQTGPKDPAEPGGPKSA